MDTSKRIKYLRRDLLGLTQQEFSEALDISRSNLGNIEIGRISVTDRVISDICEKYNINDEWLRNGTGDPFIKLDKEKELLAWAGTVLGGVDDSFKKRFVKMLSELEAGDWETLEKIALKLHNKKD